MIPALALGCCLLLQERPSLADHPDPRFRQALEIYESGDSERALEILRQACEAQPEDAERWFRVAELLVQKQDYAACLPFAEAAAERAPQSAPALALLGFAHFGLGDLGQSEAVFRRAVERFPQNANLWFQLGFSRGHNRKVLEAQPCFDRALQLDPGNPRYLYYSAENWMARGRFAEAEPLFRAAAGGERRHPDAAWKLAQALQFLGRSEEAEQWFQAALEPSLPGSPSSLQQARYHYAVFLFERDRVEAAEKLLTEFLEKSPVDRMAWLYLGRCQKALGKHQQAEASRVRYRELQTREDQEETERLLSLIEALRGDAPTPAKDSGASQDGGSSDRSGEEPSRTSP